MRYKLSTPATVFLIALTILLITAFQAYWLSNNYREEKRLFTVRTNILFRETIFRLQAVKLNLDSNISLRVHDRAGMTGITNVLQERMRDSTMAAPAMPMRGVKRTMFVSVDAASMPEDDSVNVRYGVAKAVPATTVFQFLAGVDSLRDSITVKEVTDRYQRALERENIDVSFMINTIPVDTSNDMFNTFPDDLEGNTVTIGFTKPMSYQVLFENNTWYLLKRISQPILVSFFLLAVTIFSFLLLYRNLKQQQRLAQLKNDFISNMTHELKTPIATVSVAIEALRNFDALEDLQTTLEYLDISANEMNRLALLVDKVLKLSMFENREIPLNKEPFDLTDLTRSVMISMKLQFEKQRAVTTLKRTGHNFIITADKLHMTSVLYNLLDNALKYSTEDPDILIHIIDHKQYLELRVTDNGIGIAREYKSRIFEKFFRVPSGNRHNIKGYGLGLSYVSHIVQSHMGFIEVESELHKGSTFSIKLPFAEAPVIRYDKGRRVIKLKIG
ncbi:two-component system, OmpR family, phosphate regulon sensor histidine kinase PhoR [Chitinophaga ginsengisegetis]|uniref:histidine kinase n=1 Tax=Chitinophaga ginsengisegetis TaxID=393003 RepID=A0A1T5PAG5_9BACT|nr:HAMP domain-containing sensor histidine kinase [Chitinophaga ginsengisegetis]MDR6570790.1 two-component system phosphate regulon sensor histidine kinase PhoR [Chitinophaga ginsengisegetis]MDR6650524.1 two-component system phosphate regulon sensor histidine kinase PhoR [Chitinophaga ginsengisegetis]MDR6656837.1 two-component system phosphate regulon sensor histidine kinase PhoR [Chitinophaga ginsengisegetis]SKD09249.1 two-component system, OmpR family, phosphate regulon sensor histidine kinas